MTGAEGTGAEGTRAEEGSTEAVENQQSQAPKALGPLERQVVEILWDHGPRTVRQVIDRLPTDPAYTTIATVLANLKRKGVVTTVHEGRSAHYVPTVSRADHDAAVMGGVLAASRDRSTTILRFAESMSAGDLAVLRDHLRAQRESPASLDSSESADSPDSPGSAGTEL